MNISIFLGTDDSIIIVSKKVTFQFKFDFVKSKFSFCFLFLFSLIIMLVAARLVVEIRVN